MNRRRLTDTKINNKMNAAKVLGSDPHLENPDPGAKTYYVIKLCVLMYTYPGTGYSNISLNLLA